MDSLRKSVCRGLLEQTLQPIFLRTISAKDHLTLTGILVYLMLAHAENRDELERLVRSRILDSGNPLNEICKTLQGEDESWSIEGV